MLPRPALMARYVPMPLWGVGGWVGEKSEAKEGGKTGVVRGIGLVCYSG